MATILTLSLQSPKEPLKALIGLNALNKTALGIPAFNYIQATVPISPAIGETWRKVVANRVLGEGFWDGDRWLSNQIKSAIVNSSGTAQFPAFISGICDIWLEDWIFMGYANGTHDNNNYMSYTLTQNSFLFGFNDTYGNSNLTIKELNTKGLIALKLFKLVQNLNVLLPCIITEQGNSQLFVATGFTNNRSIFGSPSLPIIPKFTLTYREVIT